MLQKYLGMIEEHIQKIQDFPAKEKPGSASASHRVMQAYLQEADEKLSMGGDAEAKDAILLACVQGINHFKISVYGTAAAYANALRMTAQAEIFHELEVNEKQIDDRLSQLAEFEINLKAQIPDDNRP